jgi:hypothetical protein
MCHDKYDRTNVLGHQQPTPGYDDGRQSQQIKRFSDRTNLSQQRMNDTSSKTIPCHSLHYIHRPECLFFMDGHSLLLFDAKCLSSAFISSSHKCPCVSPTSPRLSRSRPPRARVLACRTNAAIPASYVTWFGSTRYRIKNESGLPDAIPKQHKIQAHDRFSHLFPLSTDRTPADRPTSGIHSPWHTRNNNL